MLLASLLGLVVGPFAYRLVATRPRFMTVMDAAVVLTVTGLVLVEIVPTVTGSNAVLIVVLASLGLLGPTLLERFLHRSQLHRVENWTHLGTLTLAVAGLLVHATLEGAALGGGSGDWLPFAITLHRIPVSLAIWWLLAPETGWPVPSGVLATVGAATLLGFWLGPALVGDLPAPAAAGFQAVVAGSLLHVVFFRQHIKAHGHD